jgi:hypothetical protein
VEHQPQHPHESHELPLPDHQGTMVSAPLRRIRARARLWQRTCPMMVATAVTVQSAVPALLLHWQGKTFTEDSHLDSPGVQPPQLRHRHCTASLPCLFSRQFPQPARLSIWQCVIFPSEKHPTQLSKTRSISCLRFALDKGLHMDPSCRTANMHGG